MTPRKLTKSEKVEETTTFTVKLTPDEHAEIKEFCKAGGYTMRGAFLKAFKMLKDSEAAK